MSSNDKNAEDKKEILNNEDNFIHLKTIDQIDFVSFLSQEDIKEETVNDIRNKIILNKKNKNIAEDNLLSQNKHKIRELKKVMIKVKVIIQMIMKIKNLLDRDRKSVV